MTLRFWRWAAFVSTAVPFLAGGGGAQAVPPADPTCWIVLRGGETLAARCPYEQRGETLRFRGLDGVLVALPLALVDLEATAAARSRPSPRAARLVALDSTQPPAPSAIGVAGEAAKRAGHRGAFIDLSGLVVREPEPAAPHAAGRKGRTAARSGPSKPRRGFAPPAPGAESIRVQ